MSRIAPIDFPQRLVLGVAVMAVGLGASRAQDLLLTPGDPIIAFDFDQSSNSSYPAGENPPLAIDGNPNTKYLNFGRNNSGFIVTPASGPSGVRSFVITTANDAVERDPVTWELRGTNDPITSLDNSDGGSENWVPIASGTVDLPLGRFTAGPVVGFTNETTYTSYRLTFPTVRNAGANSMQIADVQFFPEADGTGSAILAPGDPILAVHLSGTSESSYPANEEPPKAIDGDTATKYLNFGRENSGFIVTPSVGISNVTGFTMTTANDSEERDPVGWELHGTNDPVVTVDNGVGNAENWEFIAGGDLALPIERFTAGTPVAFPNALSYASYRFTVRNVKLTTANSMQFAEIQFSGTIGSVEPIRITDFSQLAAGQFSLSWNSTPGAFYAIDFSEDLLAWPGDLNDSFEATGEMSTFPFTLDEPVPDALYFRVRRLGN